MFNYGLISINIKTKLTKIKCLTMDWFGLTLKLNKTKLTKIKCLTMDWFEY